MSIIPKVKNIRLVLQVSLADAALRSELNVMHLGE